MPQPARNDELAEQLIKVYRDAHDDLVARLNDVLAAGNRPTQVARLRDLIRANDQIIDGITEATRTWLGASLPDLHLAGATTAAQAVGSSFVWTAPHLDAVTQLATSTWDDVATRLRDVRSDTRKALRDMVADATRVSLLQSETADQAARTLAQRAAAEGLWSVEYANGARHTIADYADSVIRTTTATAYNQGSLEQCRSDGIDRVEYADGPDCHVGPGHKVGPLANGLVVELADVVYLSHPRCRRALLPAPDGVPLPGGSRGVGSERAPEPAAIAPKVARPPRKPRAARKPSPAASGPASGTVTPRSTLEHR